MARKKPTPTPEDRAAVERQLADPNYATEILMNRLVLSEAMKREERERRGRRRRLLRRLIPFVRA
jgi:hypothetical protein